MFLPENDPAKRAVHRPEFTVIDFPKFKADPARHGTRSEVFILVNFGRKLVLIGGTHYAGEIKKSIFTILNYTLPLQGVMPMHCSANVGDDGDTAEEGAGELAAKAFFKAGASKDWAGAWEAFQSLVEECDTAAEPAEDEDSEEE
jgi:phosphoenolpyruvate carboxykinase (ATP)